MRPEPAPTNTTEQRVDLVLARVLSKAASVPPRLADAMRYAVLGGGKRIRPRLVYASGRLAGAPIEVLDHAAAAVELIHAYSLIHDDLPAMDDDDLRRGRPTVHVAFDEATAILAGDALQALAFESACADGVEAAVSLRWVRLLARAAGAGGMVGGQVLDLEGETRRLSADELEQLHRKKTGALLHASVAMGAAAGNLPGGKADALDRFGTEIGLAFQIHDDVLDATIATEALGKRQGADADRGKSTYVTVLGLETARKEADRRMASALDELACFGTEAAELVELAKFIVSRRR
ncbi:MAG: polyprenyl synthetase family protein [Gammaproteobacteria bacterium]|nr:polyprenyl synthetase family protein [Gammaproteobacteria bacterium]